jgi:hypothetical protein
MGFSRPTNGNTSGGSAQDVVSITINENVSKGDILRAKVAGAHGMLEKANDTGLGCVGVAAQTGTIGTSINVYQAGLATVNFAVSLTSSDIGKMVYVSSTSGQATLTAPTTSGTTVIEVGRLRSEAGSVLLSPRTILLNA